MKFWNKIASFIIRQRLWILLGVGLVTAGMFYFSRQASLSYIMSEILPPDDPVYADYQHFRSIFGEEANVVIIAIEDPDFFQKDHLDRWMAFEKKIAGLDSVEWTLSALSSVNLVRDTANKRFDFVRISDLSPPANQKECDSLKTFIQNLPFYKNVLFNKDMNTFLLLAGINKEIINTKERVTIVNAIHEEIKAFETESGKELRISGLPFIRTDTIQKSRKEITLFIILAAAITALVLAIFFKSFWSIVVPLGVVGIGVIWSSATLVMFGYKITTLTGLIPPLLIVIGIPNAVYMITRYHQEYLKHGNKIKALSRVIEKTGKAIFLTNLTTAIGFGTLLITDSKLLIEFGTVAFINIMMLFLLSISLIPILFSLLPTPKKRHTRHLTNKRSNVFVQVLHTINEKYRPATYIVAVLIAAASILGMLQLRTSGKVVDDIPKDSKVYKDLVFFEKNFGGVMPLEIVIDTKKKKGALTNPKLIGKIVDLQDSLSRYSSFSRPVSIIDLVKFANQSFHGGNPTEYRIPQGMAMAALSGFIENTVRANKEKGLKQSPLESYLDSTGRYIRVRSQMADVGTRRMKELTDSVRTDIKAIFGENPNVDIILTGASLVIMKGTDYLLRNMLGSLLFAIALIAILMALLFKRWKMVVASLLPNILPMLFTAGLMGWMNIPVKASTCLIFSVAFGIAVDDTIHFLAKYRQELKHNKGNIRLSITNSIDELGLSMAYTSIILFCGFSIFMASDFGGTVSLGFLVSITLVVAMFTNLTLLPALIISLHKKQLDQEYEAYDEIEYEDDDEEEQPAKTE